MTGQKISIQNRNDKRIVMLYEANPDSKGLVFIMHGLGSFKEERHIESAANTFFEQGYSVVRFDVSHSIGESEGDLEDATLGNYLADLEDVIEGSKRESWYQEPFILAGHSLGGAACGFYSQAHPEKVKALLLMSPVVSGKLIYEEWEKNGQLEEWRDTGYREEESHGRPGVMLRVKWHFMEDLQKYDLLPNASKMTMPVLQIVGDLDKRTPVEHQKALYEALETTKDLKIVEGATHTFTDQFHLDQLEELISEWLKAL